MIITDNFNSFNASHVRKQVSFLRPMMKKKSTEKALAIKKKTGPSRKY